MNARILAILLLAVTVPSCEKVKTLAAKVSTAVKQQTGGKTTAAGESDKVDPELQKLVDQTAEGTVFRKDLPFPKRLEVTTTSRVELSGQGSQSSDLGKGTAPMKGTQLSVTKVDIKDGEVCFTLEKSSFTLPATGNPDPAKKDSGKQAVNEPVEVVAPPVPPATFVKSGNNWVAKDRTDFRTVSLAQKLSPFFDDLLVDSAVASRPLWFAKHRFKVGDSLVVSGASLPMLLPGNAKGSLTLKLESFDAVEGHPCGVFAVTGNYRCKTPDFAGNVFDRDATIESGKIWCSLLYPVVLKQELNVIATHKGGGKGGLESRFQGAMKVSVTHAWKPQGP